MRRLLFASLCGVMVVAGATRAHAQATGAKPPATGAPAPATGAPAQPAPAPQPTALIGPLADESTSLFAPRANMFQLSGRFASVEGDPARWQRYEDLRDGLLFTTGRLLRERPEWAASLTADNLGWRDQRYSGSYERIGRFTVSGLWDQIPQFYSVDTRTPFTSVGEGVLVLDDAAQRAANLNAYPPIAPQFDLRERRDIGTFGVSAMPSTHVDLTGHFTTTKHSGELPWGADFGFGNDNEVALPYKSRTNDVELGAQWTNTRAMIRGAYNGSWFNNIDDTLVWDNPLVLNDSTTAPGRGRTALWPSNSLQTMSTAGYVKLARRTQVTGSLAYGWWNNDEDLLPFKAQSFNLIVSGLALHRVNDLPGALIQIRQALHPDGLFMAALLGARALSELRQALLEAEAEIDGGASPRVAPFGNVREYGALLQRAGFALPVADAETLTVLYASPRELMREVRALGGGNVLLARSRAPLSRRTLERAEAIYRERHASPDGRVSASFEIVYLSGWGPDASQQQPLKPGSAAQRLADALSTTERSAGDKAAFPAKPKS